MLRLIARVNAILLPVSALVVALALLALRGQPLVLRESLVEWGFGACDLPCWAGIRLEQTDVQALEALLDQYMQTPTRNLSTNRGDFLVRAESSSGEEMYNFLWRVPGTNTVGAFHFSVELPLWYLFATFGEPTCVNFAQPTSNSFILNFIWNGASVYVHALVYRVSRAALDYDTLSSSVLITRKVYLEPLSSFAPGCASSGLPWRGLAALKRYNPSAS
jgi:hypothetical protein